MSKRRFTKPLTPEQKVAELAGNVRKQLHQGLDSLIDREIHNFLMLLDQGYALVAMVRPMLETQDGEVSGDGTLSPEAAQKLADGGEAFPEEGQVVGSIPALVDAHGNAIVPN